MTTEEKRNELIQSIADQLRMTSFTFEFKVAKKPKGIRIVHEVTREEMNEMMQQWIRNTSRNGESQ